MSWQSVYRWQLWLDMFTGRAMRAGRSEGHRCSGIGRETDLLCKALGPEEEPQQAPYDHSQHWQDEESILFAHVLHPHPHRIQSHGHDESPVLSRSPTHMFTAQIQAGRLRMTSMIEREREEAEQTARTRGNRRISFWRFTFETLSDWTVLPLALSAWWCALN